MKISAATISIIVTGAGTPKSSPAPASPLNSLSNAPIQARTKVAIDSQAQPRPKCSLISSAWPLPLTIPRRTVSSWTI